MPKHLSRDAQSRLADLSDRYRACFDEVQAELKRSDLGRIPNWVFAIDRLQMEEVQAVSETLYQAEMKRRRCRTALQALIELVSLEEPTDDNAPLPTAPPPGDDANLEKLDRFITVVNFARGGGCIYVNGTFEPVDRPIESDPKDTFDVPPERKHPGTSGET